MKWVSRILIATMLGILAFGGYKLHISQSSPKPKREFKQLLTPTSTGSSGSTNNEIPGLNPELRPIAREVGFEPAVVEEGFDQISLIDINGKPTQLSNYEDRWILLNFWATWCVPCRKELPNLQTLRNNMSDRQFNVVLINVMEPREDVEAFVDEHDLDLPVLLDKKGELTDSFGINGLPVSVILTPDSEAMMHLRGSREWDRGKLPTILQKLTKL